MSAPIPTPPSQPAAPVPGRDPAPQPPAPQPAAQPGQAPAPPHPQPPTGQAPDDGGRDLSSLPQWAQQQIRDLRAESAQRRVAARTAQVSQQTFAAASQLGVNGYALLGSAALQTAAQRLDPGAADFGAQLAAKVTELLAANPWMAAQQTSPAPQDQPQTPQAPAASGGDFPGGTGAGQPITEQQLAQMTPEQITEAYQAGRLKHLM